MAITSRQNPKRRHLSPEDYTALGSNVGGYTIHGLRTGISTDYAPEHPFRIRGTMRTHSKDNIATGGLVLNLGSKTVTVGGEPTHKSAQTVINDGLGQLGAKPVGVVMLAQRIADLTGSRLNIVPVYAPPKELRASLILKNGDEMPVQITRKRGEFKVNPISPTNG